MSLQSLSSTLNGSTTMGLSENDYAALKTAVTDGTVKMTDMKSISGAGGFINSLVKNGAGEVIGGGVSGNSIDSSVISKYTNNSRSMIISATGDNSNSTGGFLLTW
jgi:hypothetical protein